MSWKDHHLRSAIVQTVLDRAAADPADPELFADLPDLDRLFGGPEGLLTHLRYRWNNHLAAKTDQAMTEGKSVADVHLELCAEQPALRALLDAHLHTRDAASAMAR
ncbi:hypothetical protein [Nocardia bovistercoris]|uniref:Uncharacterized protein n=1 Tax=Nocardia bovistercoris TaxID=2785916 RepID=A0A931IGM1_9NOCA|nr:hypothetical protein [Nocardia bovistercoris]MBH0781377.1 hypothetical protein [Nocardia bovistercoris]